MQDGGTKQGGIVCIVGHQNSERIFARLAHDGSKALLQILIQGGEGLVQKDQIRPKGESSRQ